MMKATIFKNSKTIILTLSLLICIGLLSGCGKKADDSQATSAAGAGTETTEQKETADRKETDQRAEAVTETGTDATGETKEKSDQTKKPAGTTEGAQTAESQETSDAQTESKAGDSGAGKAGFPGDFPMSFTFSSGAGGWRTWLTLYADGTFEGQYSDSEMGDIGDGYPNGSYYIADFTGKFVNIQKVDEFSYSMELDEVTLGREPGTEWIEDEIRYVAAEAYGLDGGKEFVFYTPETPVAGLSEMFLGWWPGRFMEPAAETLSCYGIYNKAEETGFFTD